MGKRSDFKRVPRDFYPTPYEAVVPLAPYLPAPTFYFDVAMEVATQMRVLEPCAGDTCLVQHLKKVYQDVLDYDVKRWIVSMCDIEPQHESVIEMDALSLDEAYIETHNIIITNPPWNRKFLHPFITHFIKHMDHDQIMWLLIDADWAHTKQSAPYMKHCSKIVSIGRVKWIKDSKHTGKDNCAWYCFEKSDDQQTVFIGRNDA